MAQTEDLDSIRFLEAGMAAGSHGVWVTAWSHPG